MLQYLRRVRTASTAAAGCAPWGAAPRPDLEVGMAGMALGLPFVLGGAASPASHLRGLGGLGGRPRIR